MELAQLPALNAMLNTISGILLLLGWRSIKLGDRTRHKYVMIAALVSSALFLTSYLIYHFNVGSVRFEGVGLWRALYFAILIPHVILAALMVPFILTAVWFAYRHQFHRHTRITRWLWPVWIYVSVTGVLVYLMLYHL